MGYRKFTALVLALLLLTGCAGEEAPDYGPEEENRLTVCTSHKSSVYLPIVREFEERTGIWVEIIPGGTNELLEQIRSGDTRADVMFGGGVESLTAYEDCFTPYVSGQAGNIAEAYAEGSPCWTPFSALPVVLIYNTRLVDPAALTGWADLVSPRFRGSIAFADPAVSGSSFTALQTYLQAMGEAFDDPMAVLLRALDGQILEGSGDVLTAVAEGKFSVGVTLEESALKAGLQGLDVGIVYPAEGTSCLPDGIALIRNASHIGNAKRFLDFTLSYDLQSLLGPRECRRSVRSDVSHDLPPLSELNLLDYDMEAACASRDTVLAQWQEGMEAWK